MARPYGFETDRTTVRESEAAAIREVVRRLLDEEEPLTLTKAAAWLNAEGHLTATGRPWEVGTLKRTLTSPLLAGLKAGPDGAEEPRDGVEPIISLVDRAELLSRLPSGSIAKQEAYLLTGIVTCALCGQKLTASRSYRTAGATRTSGRAYVCPPPNALSEKRRGCGRIRALAEPVEDYVGSLVLARLASPKSAAAVAAVIQREEARTEEIRREIADAKGKLTELIREWAYSGTPASALREVREDLQRRVRDGEKQLTRIDLLAGSPVYDQAHLTAAKPAKTTAGVAVDPETLADWWASASVDRRRALVALMVKSVTVGPVRTRGAKTFDPDRVNVKWR